MWAKASSLSHELAISGNEMGKRDSMFEVMIKVG
jgi:hypothetical protein